MPDSFATLPAALAELLGEAVTDIRPITGGGYTPAERLVATLAGGGTVFVKRATDALTAGWITTECQVYTHLGENDFTPRFLGHGKTIDPHEQVQPFLVLEDLSHCHWPPPWSPAQIQAVQRALDKAHAVRGSWLSTLPTATVELGSLNGWSDIAQDPVPFLSLGLASPAWLAQCLSALQHAAQSANFSGDDLLHLDTRSDNLCFRPDGRACIVDWNWASRGNGIIDIAGWLPSLGYETGRLPETLLPHQPEYAAWFAGFFAARAGLPPLPRAPRVRTVQHQQLIIALPWACRALHLPLPF